MLIVHAASTVLRVHRRPPPWCHKGSSIMMKYTTLRSFLSAFTKISENFYIAPYHPNSRYDTELSWSPEDTTSSSHQLRESALQVFFIHVQTTDSGKVFRSP